MLMPGATLPYHDHPHQNVISQVVSGTLTADVFSPLTSYKAEPGEVFKAAPVSKLNGNHTEGTTMFLNPTFANIHGFANLTPDPCVFVDLIMPPYGYNVQSSDELFISYFERTSNSNGNNGEVELGVILEPEDFTTISVPSRLLQSATTSV